MTGQTELYEPHWAHQVLDDPCEFGNTHLEPCVLLVLHQILRLYRPPVGSARLCQFIDGARGDATIRVHHDDHVGRVEPQVLQAEIQREALATLLQVGSGNDLRSLRLRDARRRIGAIVRNHDQPVARSQLRCNRPQRRADPCFLVVRRNQDRH